MTSAIGSGSGNLEQAITALLPVPLRGMGSAVTTRLLEGASEQERRRLGSLHADAVFAEIDALFDADTPADVDEAPRPSPDRRRLTNTLRSFFRNPIALLAREVAELLQLAGHLTESLRWLRYARHVFNDVSIFGPSFPNHQVLYSMFLRQEASCLAELGDYAGAVDKRLKSHALNPGDPEFFHVRQWCQEPPLSLPAWHVTTSFGPELRQVILRACDVNIEVSPDVAEVTYTRELPTLSMPEPAIFGPVEQRLAYDRAGGSAEIAVLRDVRCYTDYWKSAVIDRRDRLHKAFSSGPAELVCLAQRMGFAPPFPRLPGRTAFVAANHSWMEFYHFLVEVAPRVATLQMSGTRYDTLVAHGATSRAFCREFLDLLDLKNVQLLDGLDPISFEADEVIIPRKTNYLHQQELAFLRNLYLGQEHLERNRRRLFISRQLAKDRRLANYDEVLAVLEDMAFETITFEQMTGRAQARIMSEADVIVAPHGAGLSNVLFCAPGAKVVELLPSGCPEVFRLLSHVAHLEYTAVHAKWQGSDMLVDPALVRDALRSVMV